MRRLYFIAGDLQTLLKAKASMVQMNKEELALHVWGRDHEVLINNNLPPLDPLAQSDIVHSGEQGALYGLLAGIIGGVVLSMTNPFGAEVGMLPFIMCLILFTFFGSWLGGLVGASSDNYQLERFHDQVDAGQYVMQVDVAQNYTDTLMAEMQAAAPGLVFAGENDAWNNPFKGSFVKHMSHGHSNVR
jgi:hypothetical protein